MSRNTHTRAVTVSEPLYMVAFDHRNSLRRDLAAVTMVDPAPTATELKKLIWSGVELALPNMPNGAQTAILLDRGHPEIQIAASEAGVAVVLAMEESGQRLISTEAPLATLQTDLEALALGLGKLLVRWHPNQDPAEKQAQSAVMKSIAATVEAAGLGLVFELLVPPDDDDLAEAGDKATYAREILPRHQLRAIEQLIEDGFNPTVWKLEGHSDTEAAAAVAAVVAEFNPAASIVVLGGGLAVEDLSNTFAGGAAQSSFNGFAVGRSIWWDSIRGYAEGTVTHDEATQTIAMNILAVIDVFVATRDSR